MPRTLIFDVVYPHPPESVWTAITTSSGIERWLMPNDFKPAVGHRFQLRSKPMPGWTGIIDGEVLELDPPRRMMWGWKSDWMNTTVTFTLDPVAGGTHLRLVHDGFRGMRGTILSWMMGGGWKGILRKRLREVLEGM
jgi:uncharacterized protein YndB with AHSA1/START domain